MRTAAALVLLSLARRAGASTDPGIVCIGCTLLTSLSLEGAPIGRDLQEALGLDAAAADTTPDDHCKSIGLCTNLTCSLYDTTFGPAWSDVLQDLPPAPPDWPTQDPSPRPADAELVALLRRVGSWVARPQGRTTLPGEDLPECGAHNVSCRVDEFINFHTPLVDEDGDRFGDHGAGTLRGYHWRGRDCDTTDADVHPGRSTVSETVGSDVDHDCNGIWGQDAATGAAWEDELCAGTERRGIAILGDSATAHFHVPPQWLTADGWTSEQVFSEASLVLAEDELDVPYCSWGAASVYDKTQCPWALEYNVSSLYLKLRERNRCNHRDYQNIGVNGARITTSMPLVESLARNPHKDHKMLVVLALIGNDVCNGHPGSAHMTDVDTFHDNALASLRALDAKLPQGSYVVTVSLVDGRVLWDAMNDQQHPIGSTYPQLYEFLDCSGEENPCWGWLNADEGWRNFTSERAFNLSSTYLDIHANESFENFTHIHYDPDFVTLIQDYVDETGGLPSDIIEPVDGFHPNQLGNILLAESMWDWLETNHPEALGNVNPNNAKIEALFGDQGGH